LPEGTISYRATDLEYIGYSDVNAISIGKRLDPLPAFSSSSLSLPKAMDYHEKLLGRGKSGCVMRILHAAGAKAMYVEELTATKREYEFINQKNMELELVSREEINGVSVLTVRQII
jgi:hypothetical protein